MDILDFEQLLKRSFEEYVDTHGNEKSLVKVDEKMYTEGFISSTYRVAGSSVEKRVYMDKYNFLVEYVTLLMNDKVLYFDFNDSVRDVFEHPIGRTYDIYGNHFVCQHGNLYLYLGANIDIDFLADVNMILEIASRVILGKIQDKTSEIMALSESLHDFADVLGGK